MSIVEKLLANVEMKGAEDVLEGHRSNLQKALVLLQVTVASKEPIMDPEKLAVGAELMVDALLALSTAISSFTAEDAKDMVPAGEDPIAFLMKSGEAMRESYYQRINDILTGAQEARENAHPGEK